MDKKKRLETPERTLKEKEPLRRKKCWTPKAITTPNFEDRIAELKGCVFDLHGLDQVEIFNQSIKNITKYVDRELDPLTGKALRYLKVPIISNPKKPELDQEESTTENVEKAMFQKEMKE